NNGTPLSEVNNLSFRQGECFTDTPVKVPVEFDYPSPYKSGFFEKIISENPDIEFIPLIETNRGCPNRCAYCSWGLQNAKIRQHSLQRVYDELEWVSSHKMDFLGFADANFGILPRDEDITDKIIDLYHKTGFPKKFQVSYSKNSSERVFRITEKLNKNNMDKGVTLSFQSMSQNVQKNIGRTNMYIEQFKDLLIKYNKAGIPTYTDLILGLPGETFESFKDGIELLLEYGQHKSLFVHLCEWLPCSEMGKAEYMQKFSLKYKKIPLNQPHTSPDKDDKIQEYSRIITSTYSMTESEWEDTYLFAVTVLGFHHFGLLRYICMYLYNNKQVKYTDFYYEFLKWLLSNDVENAATETIKKIKASIKNVVDKSESVVIFDEKFGNVAWPYEEYLFMNIVPDKEHFYQSIKPFLKRYLNEDIIDELVEYQSFVVKTAERGTKDFYGNYKWKDYFEALNNGEKAELKKAKVHYTIKDECSALTWPEYSKKVVWFGRRVGASIYSTEIEEADNL
ncbi:MAG: B12-binding domain-containing radical SAM protein, partial [Acutalibacteraceae bacterium]